MSLIEREQRRAVSEEAKERRYGCARCGRGTLPSGAQSFRVGGNLLNTGLKKVPCTLLLSVAEGRMKKYLPVITDEKQREAHRAQCNGWMFVHADTRICSIVKKHGRN